MDLGIREPKSLFGYRPTSEFAGWEGAMASAPLTQDFLGCVTVQPG